MAKSAVLALKITGDSRDGVRALNDAEGAGGKFGKAMGIMATGAGVALAAVGVLGKAAFDSASKLEQQAGAVDAIFGAGAKEMHRYAKAAAQTVGLAQSEYSELAAVLGAQLSNAGFAGKKLNGTVNGLVETGADLAAQFGGSTADAVSALSSVLKGETDPIEKYGVSLKQSDINARLAALGQDKLTGAALKNATAAAALQLVTEQTKTSVGAFARESDTAAGSTARLGAWWENAKATLGAGLLPIVVAFTNFLQQNVAPAIDRLTAAGGPLRTFLEQLGAVITTQVLPTLSSLWNQLGPRLMPLFAQAGSMLKNVVLPAFRAVWQFVAAYVVPILVRTLGPALSGITSAWKSVEASITRNSGKFRDFYRDVQPLLNFLRDYLAPVIGGTLRVAFVVLGAAIGNVIDKLSSVLALAGKAASAVGKVGSFLNPFDAANPTAVGPAAPTMGLFGAAASGPSLWAAGTGGGGIGSASRAPALAAAPTVNITVNGALDPVAVGRQLRRLLDDYSATAGRRTAVAMGGRP